MFRRVLQNPSVKRVFGQRFMGGGHHAHPKDGFEGAVRKYLPENEHVVLGITAFYTSLYLLSKLIFGGKKSDAPVVASTPAADGEMPSVDSAEFDSWISAEGNVEKLFG